MVVDALVTGTAYVVAMLIRFAEMGLIDSSPYLRDLGAALPVIVTIHLLINAMTGLYRPPPPGYVWPGLLRRVAAVVLAVMIVFILLGVARPYVIVPLGVVLLAGAELILLNVLMSTSLPRVSTDA